MKPTTISTLQSLYRGAPGLTEDEIKKTATDTPARFIFQWGGLRYAARRKRPSDGTQTLFAARAARRNLD
ncbi:hypothetical protein CA831_06545 [Burkholderia multivorans]|nr:hypothetical protein CA831_06545 [Burkholderia multivorans]